MMFLQIYGALALACTLVKLIVAIDTPRDENGMEV